MKKFKKVLSYILIVSIILPLFPIGEIKAYAFEQDKYKVEEVTLIRNYDRDGNSISATISIFGEYLKDAPIGIFTNTDGYVELPNSSREINNENVLQFKLTPDEIGSRLYIGNREISLKEEMMPNITSITTKKVEEGEDLRFEGTNLNQIPLGINVYLDREGETDITSDLTFSGSQATVRRIRAKSLGLQDIVFKKSDTQRIDFNDLNKGVNVKVNITYTYGDQFLLYKPIVVENLVMKPTRGVNGDTIYFEAPANGKDTDLNKYDVFFLEATDGTDDYTIKNKGENTKFQPKVKKDGIEYNILTTQVPKDISIGEYYVVLTNVVPDGKDPMDNIFREIVLEQKFRVIDGEKKSTISLIDPKDGPDTGGTKVTIMGKFFGSLNIDEFKPNTSIDPTIETPKDEVNPKSLILSYGGGQYGDENPIPITKVERRLKVIIGVESKFVLGEKGEYGEFDPKSDIIYVETNQVTDPGVKNVRVEIDTIFYKAGGGTIEISEIADDKTFEYIKGQIAPEIESIVPELIGVKKLGMSYEVPEDRQIAIYGKDLMIHKYTDENGEEQVVYPEIRFGNIILDKNKDEYLDIKVLNENGKILDGTKGNELGTKILITIPKGTKVTEIGRKDVRVTNPTRNSKVKGLFDNVENAVEFVAPRESLDPIIYSVNPYTSPLEGGQEITIKGTNFQPGVKVYLDGAEIKSIDRKEDGKQITFETPPGREGETMLQVMNVEGGMATHPFVYVKTYTDPKIIDFGPKRGNTDTLVTVKGQFFIMPEPMRDTDSIFKLIGARILLDGQDINEYNTDPQNKNLITLKSFKPNNEDNKLFRSGEKGIEVADYYDGIMLKDKDGINYIVHINPNGEIELSDGGSNIYSISLNGNNDVIGTKQGGEEHKITVDNNSITLENTVTGENNTFTYLTPYTTKDDKIIGKKVQVIDSNTIYFRVPILPNEKYYDLTVLNPDTKRDERLGNNGFYYILQPGSKPNIEEIVPNEGSVDGGYSIDILGSGFPRGGDSLPTVFINGVAIEQKDLELSPDGKAIRVLKVPPYNGDLVEDKGTSRWGVPVVVLNPDGSTDSKEKGFFYVVPSSQPKINKIDPKSGSASGGEKIKIMGEQFRYYEPYDDKNRNGRLDEDQGETYSSLYDNGRWDDLNDENYRGTEEWKAAAGETPLDKSEDKYYYDSPILPKVYFGNTQAKIVYFEEGYMEVILPKKSQSMGEKVKVYLLNNDGAVSNEIDFTYEVEDVIIESMIPNIGPKEGGATSTLSGEGFSSTEIEVYKDNYKDEKSDIDTLEMPLIRFGDRTNIDIPWNEENGGEVEMNKATVRLLGGLRVDYNGDEKTLELSIVDGEKEYRKTIKGYDNSVKYIPVDLLKSNGTPYKGKEFIRVNIEGTRISEDKIINARLVVERGYSPDTTLVNKNEIRINETPSYHTVEKVKVIHINNQGGSGETIYEYKNPDSNPKIENIQADGRNPIKKRMENLDPNADVLVLKVNHKGQSIITVEGSDFRVGATVQMGSLFKLEGDAVTVNDSNSLTFILPVLDEKTAGTILPLIVQNEDGASHQSDKRIPKIFIEITKGESNPEITSIKPIEGPSTGGTKVRIKGKDFRQKMEGYEGESIRVYFGENQISQSDIKWIEEDRSIEVIAPKSEKLGDIKVKVENPDGSPTTGEIYFTYISKPKIDKVSPNKIFTNDTETEITLTGKQFFDGAKVILGGEIVSTKDLEDGMEEMASGILGVDPMGNNQVVSVVGGVEAATVKVEDENTIKITLNEVTDLENTSIIVVNDDGGVSDPYDKFEYEIPRPNKPLVIEAIPGYESTVKLIWSKSSEDILNKANSFEIYGRKSDEKTSQFIKSTSEHDYLIKSLEANTEYYFQVRALNKYGASIDFATVKVKTLNNRQDDKRREKEEKLKKEQEEIKSKGKVENRNGRLYITLGTDSFKNNATTVDLSLSKYSGQKKITVAVPLELARRDNRITIKDNTMTYISNIRDMYTLDVSKHDDGSVDNYLRIHLDKSIEERIPKGKKALSYAYEIKFDYVYGKNSTQISRLLRSGKLFLKENNPFGANSKGGYIYRFIEETGQYKKDDIKNIDVKGSIKAILLSE